MIIKTLFLASFLIACALASKDEHFPAALLVQSNFDYSLTRNEFRVHYGGPKPGSTPSQVSIKIYGPDDAEVHSYDLKDTEKNTKNAFQFALDVAEAGTYKVAVCEDSVCFEKSPSLTDVTLTNTHTLSCDPLGSTEAPITVQFVAPMESDWAKAGDYTIFEEKIKQYMSNYQTDNTKYGMGGSNPVYKKKGKYFHTAIKHDLRTYKPFFKNDVDPYCGRTNMLSLHSHVVDKVTKKVFHRSKTVNYLSQQGIKSFILGTEEWILLESTHKNVVIPDNGEYEVWVSLCVTDKDGIESTYCSIPIKKDLTIE